MTKWENISPLHIIDNTIKSKNNFMFPTIFVVTLFESRCCSLHLLLLLSLSATMATAKDFPGPTTGKYASRRSSQATLTLCDAGSGAASRHITTSHSMNQTITMHGCPLCWHQLLSLQSCQWLHKLMHKLFMVFFAQWNRQFYLKGAGLETSFQQWLSPKVCQETFYIFVITYYINMF